MSMTVDELEELIKRASEQKSGVALRVRSTDIWTLCKNGPLNEDLHDATLPEVIAKLREWATPPKPATITIEVPFEAAVAIAKYDWAESGRVEPVAALCREAIKPFSQF